MRPLEDAGPVAPCGHTDPVNGRECGDRVAAWWAETLRRLAEASPAYWAGTPAGRGPGVSESAAKAGPVQERLW